MFFAINSFAQNIKVAIVGQTTHALNYSDGKFLGVVAKNYQCVFEQLPYTIEYQVLPYARLLKWLKKGEVDIGLPLFQSALRDEIAHFTLPVVNIPVEIYSQKPIDDKTKLDQLSVVLARSSAMKEVAYQYNMKPFEVNNWLQAIKMVKYGRHDAMLIPAVLADGFDPKLLKGLFSKLITTTETAMYISKQTKNKDEVLTQLNLAIKNCVTSK